MLREKIEFLVQGGKEQKAGTGFGSSQSIRAVQSIISLLNISLVNDELVSIRWTRTPPLLVQSEIQFLFVFQFWWISSDKVIIFTQFWAWASKATAFVFMFLFFWMTAQSSAFVNSRIICSSCRPHRPPLQPFQTNESHHHGKGEEKCAVSSWFIYCCCCRFRDHLQPDPVYLFCNGQICKKFDNLASLPNRESKQEQIFFRFVS